jgi:hypothetical protein
MEKFLGKGVNMRVVLRMFLISQAIWFVSGAGDVRAQWPGDPAVNMIICDRAGEQTLAKVAATSDGGCYVSWQDHASGNYDVYMQRLNGAGEIEWPENGLLISDHPQETWITDYDLTADLEDNAVVVFNDVRNGSDRDIYAYRISPEGDFVWGADGLTVSDNDGFEPDPQVVVTSDGNIVIAWPEDNMAHLRKVTPGGDDFWDPSTITLSFDYSVNSTRLAEAEADGVILEIQVSTGPNFWDPCYLHMHKFDASGTALWGPDGVEVMTTGGIAAYMRSEISGDGSGGAYSFWYDTRNVEHHAYVQHVDVDGGVMWTPNGVMLSTTGGEMQMYPALAKVPSTDDVIVFYRITDLNQTLYGIGGQKLNSLGERQWGDGGIVYVPASSEDRYNVLAFPQEDGAMVIYKELPEDVVNSIIKAIRVDGSGSPVWEPSPVTMVTTLSEKGTVAADDNPAGVVVASWNDDRFDASGDIYLQNINPDGSFGGSSACDYMAGDCNHNGVSLELADVVTMIGMYRGTTEPYYTCDCPPHGADFAPEADPNGNCQAFELGDVVTEIAAYRGTGTASGCEDCPGSG